MGYALALNNAWQRLEKESAGRVFTVYFLADAYSVDVNKRSVLSLSCNAPSKDFLSILILHYLEKKVVSLPPPSGEWISFKDIPESLGCYTVFRKRVIEPVLRKYGTRPEALLEKAARFGAKSVEYGDIGVAVDTFKEIPLLITLFRGDEEFGPEANVLFDKSILDIFCTEDIIVLAEFVARMI